MKVEDLMQIAVVDEDDAVTFQNEFNKRIRELANYPHKVEFSQTRDFCAVIKYYITTKELETVADEFHAEGIRFSCENCPLHEVQTDGRKKRVACKYHELGITHLKHEACELFYKKLKQGELEPVGL